MAARKRSTLCDPLGDPAIEDCHVLRTEMAKHEPRAGSCLHRAVIINDDPAAVTEAEGLHLGGECRRRGQSVLDRGGGIDQRREVHEHRTGDMAVLVLGARIAARLWQVLARIDDPKVARAEFGGEPFGRNPAIQIRASSSSLRTRRD